MTEHRNGLLRTNWIAWDAGGQQDGPMRILNGNVRSRWLSAEAPVPPAGAAAGAGRSAHSLTFDMRQPHRVAGFTYAEHFRRIRRSP
jgi:hypothetical protein